MYTTDNPYGYWIGKDEIYPVVKTCQHHAVASQIIEKIFGDRYGRIYRKYDIYRVMFRLGFVRVVNDPDGYLVEVRHDVKLSKLQKGYIQDAQTVDKIHYNRWRVR